MDLTQGTPEVKRQRAKRMMLWFTIVSLIMSFAGWTSAIIISSNRPDWLHDYDLPQAFFISTILIIASSIALIFAKQALKNNKRQLTSLLLVLGIILGIAFINVQFIGFNQIIDMGYNFTGPTSNVTMSFVFLIAFVHILHVVVGLVCLLVVIYNHFKQKYNALNKLGFDLALTFWHFVDILWLFLFLFLYFF